MIKSINKNFFSLIILLHTYNRFYITYDIDSSKPLKSAHLALFSFSAGAIRFSRLPSRELIEL